MFINKKISFLALIVGKSATITIWVGTGWAYHVIIWINWTYHWDWFRGQFAIV